MAGPVRARSGRDTQPCWQVIDIEAPHYLVLMGAGTPARPEVVDRALARDEVAATWQWVLEPVDDGERTRLIHYLSAAEVSRATRG